MATNRDYYSQILTTVYEIESENVRIKKCFILAIILLSRNTTMIQTH